MTVTIYLVDMKPVADESTLRRSTRIAGYLPPRTARMQDRLRINSQEPRVRTVIGIDRLDALPHEIVAYRGLSFHRLPECP